MDEFSVVDIAKPGDVVILGITREVGIDELTDIAERLQNVTDEKDVSFVIFEKGIELLRIERKVS